MSRAAQRKVQALASDPHKGEIRDVVVGAMPVA